MEVDAKTRERRAPRQDLTPLLHARSVAIVGISQPGRFGGILFDEPASSSGYEGSDLRREPALRDALRPALPTRRSRDLPERPDCALLAVPECTAGGRPSKRRLPAGFRRPSSSRGAWSEPGEEPSLQRSAAGRSRESRHDMVVCGPNCMGFVSTGPPARLRLRREPATRPPASVALISHSGSVWEGFLQNQRGVAFNYIVSPGNEMVTTVADYMQFALADESTRAIGLVSRDRSRHGHLPGRTRGGRRTGRARRGRSEERAQRTRSAPGTGP